MQKLKHISIHWLTLTLVCFSLILLLSYSNTQAQIKEAGPWDLNANYSVGTPITITGIEDNLSGLSYQPETDHLFAVLNNPEQLIELTKQGDIVRRISLDGFIDTESVAYLGQNQFVVTEERRQNLVFFTIDEKTKRVSYSDSKHLHMNWAKQDNQALEGLAWSPYYGFFILQEDPPLILNHVTDETASDIRQVDVEKLNQALPKLVEDFAGISLFYIEQSPHLLVLSEASHELNLINLNGNTISTHSLKKGFFNLWPIMKQPEGVTVDNDGNIFIVGEPNQLLMLKRHTRLNQGL